MTKIAILFVKKHGGYPHNGGGVNAITFFMYDIKFIVKTINDLNFEDNSIYYILTTTNNLQRTADGEITINDDSKLIKKLLRDLKKETVNKKIIYQYGVINLFSDTHPNSVKKEL